MYQKSDIEIFQFFQTQNACSGKRSVFFSFLQTDQNLHPVTSKSTCFVVDNSKNIVDSF